MSRRVSLPGAAELFRVTGDPSRDDPAADGGDSASTAATNRSADPDRSARRSAAEEPGGSAGGAASTRAAVREADLRDADLRDADGRDADGRERDGRGDDDLVGGGSDRGRDRDRDGDADWDAPAARPRRRVRVSERRPTGRERHDEKITVYCSPQELLDLEHARLTLRGDFGLAVDRGRIVREAMAVVLADLDAKGESSILVRRLRGRG